jgi:hypothetical protein
MREQSAFPKVRQEQPLTFHLGTALVNSGFSTTGPLIQRQG